jgi:hypothetical protein
VTNAEIVVTFGQRVWGHSWTAGMSVFAEVNPRTLARIYAASRRGEEYPAARGVIGALARALEAVQADLAPWAERADQSAAE